MGAVENAAFHVVELSKQQHQANTDIGDVGYGDDYLAAGLEQFLASAKDSDGVGQMFDHIEQKDLVEFAAGELVVSGVKAFFEQVDVNVFLKSGGDLIGGNVVDADN